MHEGPYDYDSEESRRQYKEYLASQQAREDEWWAWMQTLPDYQFNAVCAAERQRGEPLDPGTRTDFMRIVKQDAIWFRTWSEHGMKLTEFDAHSSG